MQNKMLKLFVVFVAVFSLRGFSQTTEKSNHPLLDKYYPQKQGDTSKTITTQINPVPETKPVTSIKPEPATKSAPDTKSMSITKPEPLTKPEPQINTISETNPIAETKPALAVTDTTAIIKPTNPAVPAPVQKPVQARPPATFYRETRLGSSSPLYNTYEKNRNNAGSVTTSPK